MTQDKDTDKSTTENAIPAVDETTSLDEDVKPQDAEQPSEPTSTADETTSPDEDVKPQDTVKQNESTPAEATPLETEIEPEAASADEANLEAASAQTDDPTAALQAELEAAKQEAAQNLEKWQRTAAELANFKRRQEEQLKLQRDTIKSEVLQGVISALDDLDLAFQNLPDEIDGQLLGWVEGFRLVQRKLGKILDDQNVMPIDTSGVFDPNFHEAISYEEMAEYDSDHVIAELRKGYQIGNRVIRPALVRVAR